MVHPIHIRGKGNVAFALRKILSKQLLSPLMRETRRFLLVLRLCFDGFDNHAGVGIIDRVDPQVGDPLICPRWVVD